MSSHDVQATITALVSLITALAALVGAVGAVIHSRKTRAQLWAHRTTPLNDHQQPYR